MKIWQKKTVLLLITCLVVVLLVVFYKIQTKNNQIQETTEDVLRKIVTIYETEESVVDHFGTVQVNCECNYVTDDYVFSYKYTTDGKTYSLVDFNEVLYIYNDGDWYGSRDYSTEDITFSKVMDYEDEKDQIAVLENYIGDATFTIPQEELTNNSFSMKSTPTGYEISTTIEGENDSIGHYSSDTRLVLNKDYRIEGIEYICTNEDGDLVYTESVSYEYDVPTPFALDAYYEKQESAAGKTRTVTQHILKNNEEIETYVSEIPLGFDIFVYYPVDIMDSMDKYGYGRFLDRNGTKPAPEERDLYNDREVYILLYESDAE